MTGSSVKSWTDLVLPAGVVTKLDLSRLINGAEQVDNELTTATVRSKVDSSKSHEPMFSDQFAEFLKQNQFQFTDSGERSHLIKQLRILKDKAPVVHMTFAAAADHQSLAEIAGWLRSSIHRQAIVEVGLQPSLVAGVYLRTPNQVHDLSLSGLLEERRDVLTAELGVLRGEG